MSYYQISRGVGLLAAGGCPFKTTLFTPHYYSHALFRIPFFRHLKLPGGLVQCLVRMCGCVLFELVPPFFQF